MAFINGKEVLFSPVVNAVNIDLEEKTATPTLKEQVFEADEGKAFNKVTVRSAQGIYDEGYAQGRSDADEELQPELENQYREGCEDGKQAERDAFWNVFQNNGGTANYYFAFADGKFTDDNYNPQHPIRCKNGNTPGQQIFYKTKVTDTKVPIYLNSNNAGNCFGYTAYLRRIHLLHVQQTTDLTSTFAGATALEEITIDGVIGRSVSFADCPLNLASAINVIQHLVSLWGVEIEDEDGQWWTQEYTETIIFSKHTWDLLDSEDGLARLQEEYPDMEYVDWRTAIDSEKGWNYS